MADWRWGNASVTAGVRKVITVKYGALPKRRRDAIDARLGRGFTVAHCCPPILRHGSQIWAWTDAPHATAMNTVILSPNPARRPVKKVPERVIRGPGWWHAGSMRSEIGDPRHAPGTCPDDRHHEDRSQAPPRLASSLRVSRHSGSGSTEASAVSRSSSTPHQNLAALASAPHRPGPSPPSPSPASRRARCSPTS